MDREVVRNVVLEVLKARLEAEARGPASAPSPAAGRGRPVVTEREVMEARTRGRMLVLAPGSIVTPLAREAAERYAVTLVTAAVPPEPVVTPTPGAGPAPEAPAAGGDRASGPGGPAPVAPVGPAGDPPGCPAPASAAGVVALGADHGGFALKEVLKGFLETEAGYRVVDYGTYGAEAVDYPDFAHKVAAAVARGEAWRGVIVDGVGVGSCMAANRHPGVRAAAATGVLEVVNAREHNDANVLCLGGRIVGDLLARSLLSVFLTTAFAGGRHQRRVEKIDSGIAGAGSKGAGCSSPG